MFTSTSSKMTTRPRRSRTACRRGCRATVRARVPATYTVRDGRPGPRSRSRTSVRSAVNQAGMACRRLDAAPMSTITRRRGESVSRRRGAGASSSRTTPACADSSVIATAGPAQVGGRLVGRTAAPRDDPGGPEPAPRGCRRRRRRGRGRDGTLLENEAATSSHGREWPAMTTDRRPDGERQRYAWSGGLIGIGPGVGATVGPWWPMARASRRGQPSGRPPVSWPRPCSTCAEGAAETADPPSARVAPPGGAVGDVAAQARRRRVSPAVPSTTRRRRAAGSRGRPGPRRARTGRA